MTPDVQMQVLRPSPRKRWRLLALIVLLVGLWMVFCTPIVTDYIRMRTVSSRAACSQRLFTVGRAYRVYEKKFGRPPADVQELINAGVLAADVMRTGPSDHPVQFVPARFVTTAPASIIAYEPLENHGDGACALFADGHTAWLNKQRFEREIKLLQTVTTPLE